MKNIFIMVLVVVACFFLTLFGYRMIYKTVYEKQVRQTIENVLIEKGLIEKP